MTEKKSQDIKPDTSGTSNVVKLNDISLAMGKQAQHLITKRIGYITAICYYVGGSIQLKLEGVDNNTGEEFEVWEHIPMIKILEKKNHNE